jgi:hypothetical protein
VAQAFSAAMYETNIAVTNINTSVQQFTLNLQQAEQAAKVSAEGVGGAMKDLGSKALGVAADFAQWINAAIDAQAKIDEMSQKLGMSAEATSKLSAIAKISGTDFDTLGKAMQKLSDNAMNAAAGAGESRATFQAMGISVADAAGQMKAGDQLLAEISDKFSGYTDGAEKSALAAKLFGDAGTSLIPMLNGGSGALDDYVRTAEQFGAVVSGDSAQAAAEFQENLAKLEMAGSGLANMIAAQIVPILAEYSGYIVDAAQQSGVLSGAADVLSGTLKVVGGIVVVVTNFVQGLTNAVAAVVDSIGGIGTRIGGVMDGASEMLAGVMSLGAGDLDGFVAFTDASTKTIAKSWSQGGREIDDAWANASVGIEESIGDFNRYISSVEQPIVKIDEALRKRLAPSLEAVKVAFGQFGKAQNMGDIFAAATTTLDAMGAAFGKLNEKATVTAPSVRGLGEAIKTNTDAKKKNTEETDKAAAAYGKLQEMLGSLNGALSPVDAANEKHAKTQRDLAAALDEAKGKRENEAEAVRIANEALKASEAIRNKELAKIKEQGDVLGRYLKELDKSREFAGMNERQKAIAQAVQTTTKEYEANTKAGIENQQTIGELTQKVSEAAAAWYDDKKAIDDATAAAKRQTDIVRNGMNSMADAIANWAVNGFGKARDFWKGMVDIVKRSVAQMIAEWIKTRIIGQFFNSGGSGGSGSGNFITRLGAMFFGGSGVSLAQNTAMGGWDLALPAADGGATGGFNYGSSVLDAGGRYVWDRVVNPAGTSSPGQVGGSSMMGTWTPGVNGASGSFAPSAFGWAAGAAAGVYAGYNRYQNSNGGLAGGLGAAAYGMGTMGVMGGLGSVAAGGTFAAGFSAMAIPVIGWIAAIAMLVDMIAGGKLFGTKARTQYTDSRIDLGAEGAEASMQVTTVRERSLFRGRQWSTSAGEVTPEMTEAANKFWKQLAQIAKDVAKSIGSEVAPVIDASLRTVTEYDKKGREKATKYIVEALGRSWEEASAELATKRIAAEQMIASLDFNQKEGEASKIAERYRKEAEALADAAATMVQARADLNDGKGLLGGGDTLTSVMAWVEEQRKGDETLTATYARLSQATAQYNALVEQTAEALEQIRVGAGPVEQLRAALEQITKQTEATVKALNDAAIAAGLTAAREEDLAAVRDLEKERIAQLVEGFWGGIDQQFEALTRSNTPAGDFVASMQAISQSLHDNIAQANMLARAQGQAGASTQQLARIHELAARQASSAISRLTDIGRNQVRSLYGGAFTLDQVNADIAALQTRANAASGAVQDFGGAMTDAANAANNAMNLLLGDLSPLNDQEKLQHALAGLSAGTVSQEQVLEIGRRLYASSANYTALFNQVSAMGGAGAAAGGGGGGGGGGNNGPVAQPLSAEEQQKLKDLLLQRDELIKQQRVNEARDLANTVAMLAASTGESFADVAKNLKFDLAQLAKDLGLKDLDALNEYLSDIDVSTDPVIDSFTDNTDRLIATMEKFWGPKKDEGGTPGADDPKSSATNADVRNEVRLGTEANERLARDSAVRLERIDASIRELGRDIREAFNSPRSSRMTV